MTTTDKGFLKEELIERILLADLFKHKTNCTNVKATQLLSKARYDVTFTSGYTECIADMKVRTPQYNYEYFLENGLFIEKKKWDWLTNNPFNYLPVYVNYIPLDESEGYIAIINLKDCVFKEKDKNVFIGRSNSYQLRHVIDMVETPMELIKCNYSKIFDNQTVKDTLNIIFKAYTTNNETLKSLFNIL